MRKITLLAAVLLLVFPLVIAVRPVEFGDNENLTVTYIHSEFLFRNTTIKLNFHVFNFTGGAVTNASPISCYIHIYNNSGRHIVRSELTFDNGYDWEIGLPSNISNRNGIYPYVAWCNSTTLGHGWVADYFEITNDGQAKSDDPILASIIILLPLILAYLLIKWSDTLNDTHSILKLFLQLSSFMFIFVALWFSTEAVIRFFSWDAIIEDISLINKLIGYLFFSMLGYFLIRWLWDIFSGMGKKGGGERFDY